MNGKTALRSILIICLLAMATMILSAVPPLAAEANAFSLTVNVDPPGSGSVDVNPNPPYSQNQQVTLTATAASGFVFDKWVLADSTKWWDAGWDYRVPVTAAAAGYVRKDKPADFSLNFTQLWNSLGTPNTLDPNSIRVVEVDGDDNVIDDAVPFQFDKATDFNATTKAAGTLVLIMEGNTAAGATRRYHVYFDKTGKGFTAPNIPAQVILTDNVTDEDQASFKIETPAGTLFLHKKGGGFSSFIDTNGNDWINYKYNVAGAGGTFRGIPNAVAPANGGQFHPGSKAMTVTLLSEGPVKASFHVKENKAPGRPKWEATFEVYPNYVVFTMLVAPYNYWVLYEGTPGGSFEGNSDFVVRNDGTQTNASQSWDGDLVNEEWTYIADPVVGRSIFFANQIDDTKIDSFAPAENVMTKFGFGRSGASYILDKTVVPREFTFGLMNETVYDNAKPVIYNAYRDLNVNTGEPEARAGASLGSQNPVQFTITGEHTITAQFKPAQYTVTVGVSPAETGTVTKSPNKATYDHNESVTLAAAPTVDGYHFVEWQGDVTGSENPKNVQVTKNMVVTAVFAQTFTVTTSAVPAGGGSMTLDPPGPTYAPGTAITVTATANTGFTFTGWDGDLSGTNPVEFVTVNGNLDIIANFGEPQFTFSATSAGHGTVDWTPKKASYAAGESVTVTATPDTDYAFSNWTGDLESNVNPLIIPINANTSIVGNFIVSQNYTLSVTVPSGGGSVTKDPDQPTYPTNTVVTLTAVPGVNKRFVGWGGAASGTNPEVDVTMTGNLTVTATFEDDVHPLNVTVSPPEGGIVSRQPNQASYVAGTVVTLTATANPSWTFSGWTGPVAEPTNPTTTVTVTEGGTSVTANFTAPGPFTLDVSQTGNGSGSVQINPNKAEYTFGEIVTLTATPTGASVFSGWSGDATGAKNPLTVTMDGDKNITATFILPAGPQSDNFNSCALSPFWGQLIDPLGGGQAAAGGTQLRLTVPGGASHNVWSDGNNAPRIMQPADNVDFAYVVKFDSQVTETAQMQGLIIEESAGRFARFDFEYNGGLKAYAATIYDGTARKRISIDILNPTDATYMRVTRGGNKWVMDYSPDGINWTKAGQFNNFVLNVTKAGLFAGNVVPDGANPSPAHTMVVDYFQNVANGEIPQDEPLLDLTIVGGGTVNSNPPLDQLACGQNVTLTAVPGPGATFSGWSGDATGSQTSVTLLLNGHKAVTATFAGATTRFLLLPMVVR